MIRVVKVDYPVHLKSVLTGFKFYQVGQKAHLNMSCKKTPEDGPTQIAS